MDRFNFQSVRDNFIQQWNAHLAIAPELELDSSWPSVGVIDLLTYCLRGSESQPERLKPLLEGSAVYLADIAVRCWAAAGIEAEVYLGESGIEIRARGSELIPAGEEIIVELESLLTQRIIELPYPFPVAGSLEIPISFESNIVSPLSIGLMTGLIPGLQGPWEHFNPEDLSGLIEPALRVLARTSAEHYTKLYPNEPMGQMPELYLNGLIYPPLLMKEELPFVGAVKTLSEYFKQYDFTPELISQLGSNLARSPDDLLSCAGIVLHSAFVVGPPDRSVVASALAKGSFTGMLRRAMCALRASYGFDSDWAERGISTPGDRQRLELEQQLTILPWLILSAERLAADSSDGKLIPLVVSCCEYDHRQATKLVEQLVESEPMDFELRMQQVYLAAVVGDHEQAYRLAQALAAEPGIERSAKFFNLYGMSSLEMGKLEKASDLFTKGIAIIGSQQPEGKLPDYKLNDKLDRQLAAELHNSYGCCLIHSEQVNLAAEHFDLAIELSSSPITAIINRLQLCAITGEIEQVRKLQKMAFAQSPTNRQVFSKLILSSAG